MVFSQSEIAQLIEFSEKLGLDIGEIDVLRDNSTSRIYAVDVAKTPHSPGDGYIGINGLICMWKAAKAFERQFLSSAA